MLSAVKPIEVPREQWQKVAEQRIYFGHKSVGDNIVQGLREIMAANPDLRLNLVHADTTPDSGPVFLEFQNGENTDPKSKNASFLAFLSREAGQRRAISLFKYCYIDINAFTNVGQLFRDYQDTVDSVNREYPSIKLVHVTIPLTTVEPAWKASFKSLLGRPTQREANVKRNQYNELLRSTYRNRAPIFDLAEAESTRLDRSRSYFTKDGNKIYILVPEFTTDGGHLNEIGRRAAAMKFVATLASI